jgi:hypothetical protein
MENIFIVVGDVSREDRKQVRIELFRLKGDEFKITVQHLDVERMKHYADQVNEAMGTRQRLIDLYEQVCTFDHHHVQDMIRLNLFLVMIFNHTRRQVIALKSTSLINASGSHSPQWLMVLMSSESLPLFFRTDLICQKFLTTLIRLQHGYRIHAHQPTSSNIGCSALTVAKGGCGISIALTYRTCTGCSPLLSLPTSIT